MQAKLKAMLRVNPGMRLVEDESPWVDVRLEARTARGAWHAEKDVLELHDVPFIAAWFRALASGADTHPAVHFESLTSRSSQSAISNLASDRGHPGREFRPLWMPGMIGDPPDPSFAIRVTRRMLIEAASSLEAQVRRVLT